jgi:hypothetical protein
MHSTHSRRCVPQLLAAHQLLLTSFQNTAAAADSNAPVVGLTGVSVCRGRDVPTSGLVGVRGQQVVAMAEKPSLSAARAFAIAPGELPHTSSSRLKNSKAPESESEKDESESEESYFCHSGLDILPREVFPVLQQQRKASKPGAELGIREAQRALLLEQGALFGERLEGTR